MWVIYRDLYRKAQVYLYDALESFGGLLVLGDEALAVAAPRGVELNNPDTVAVDNLLRGFFTGNL